MSTFKNLEEIKKTWKNLEKMSGNPVIEKKTKSKNKL